MSSNADVDKLGYGPLQSRNALMVSSQTLGTTPTEFRPTWPTGQTNAPKGVKIKIFNGHATQGIGWKFTDFNAAAPTITADFAPATPSSQIGAGATEFFCVWWENNLPTNPGWSLWLVASGANTTVNVTFDIIG